MPDELTDPNIPRLKRDWKGRLVRLKREVETRGGTVFEPGEVMRVHRNHGGLDLEAFSCRKECGRTSRCFVRKVREMDVELLVKGTELPRPPGRYVPVDVDAIARTLLDSVGGGDWKPAAYRDAAAKMAEAIRPIETARADWESMARDFVSRQSENDEVSP